MSSNQDLWKIITGQSSIRESLLVKTELCSPQCLNKLRLGLRYYKSPSAESARALESKVGKGPHLEFVRAISSSLCLDQCQSSELYRGYLGSVYRGPLSELGGTLGDDRKRVELLYHVADYYQSERIYLLRCVHQLLSYWQDGSHPYQATYRECLDMLDPKDEGVLIKSAWEQYADCVKATPPANLKCEREGVWMTHNLREQSLLLEIVLLYYKDYKHTPTMLLQTIKTLQAEGFGSRQSSKVSLVPSAQSLIQHLNHLSTLILVEAVDLDYVQQYLTDQVKLRLHHLHNHPAVKDIDELLVKWGNLECHAPFLLAWMLFHYATNPTELERYQLLGNQALQCGVFEYLLSILDSPFFSGSMALASLVKVLVHTLLSVAIKCFSETSLGDSSTLVAIATKTLTHPRLQQEFWEECDEGGVGVLLSTAMAHFPLKIPFPLLITLASHPHTAHSLTAHLLTLHTITLEVGANWKVSYHSGDFPVLLEDTLLYEQEARMLGVNPLCLPAGTKGTFLSSPSDQEMLVCWECDYSAINLLTLLTASLLTLPGVGVDSMPHPLIAMVTDIAKLVTQILTSDNMLGQHFETITSQYFTIVQRYSPLPHPPTQLIAACIQSISVMIGAGNIQVWEKLCRTGCLPGISRPLNSSDSFSLSVGHFGNILNTWERSHGDYVVTMAILDLLLALYKGNVAMDTDSVLACVVWMCEEVMVTCEGWRHRYKGSRECLTHKLLLFCAMVLRKGQSDRVGAYLSHTLLHSHCHRTLTSTLSLGVGVVNKLLSNQQGPPPVLIESLKLTFEIITELLHSSTEEATTLERALVSGRDTPTSGPSHLVSIIAFYIHHHGDPHVAIGATKLLTRLSLVSPVSVFGCLGDQATPIRDVFVRRLCSRVEAIELKVCVVELVRVCVLCQPGMAELFLCIRSCEGGGYTLDKASCLHPVLDIVDKGGIIGSKITPTLYKAAVGLLVSLWEGRHDAALVGLRSSPRFWPSLTAPLTHSTPHTLEDGRSLQALTGVMKIVTMEIYFTNVKSQLDKELKEVVSKLDLKVNSWIEATRSGEVDYCAALSALLLVLCSSSQTGTVFTNSALRVALLDNLLTTLDHVLAEHLVSIATELCTLYLVLCRKWSHDIDGSQSNKALSLVSRFLLSMPSELATPLYAITLHALQWARHNSKCLESRYCVALIPAIAHTLDGCGQHPHGRTEVLAMSVLSEIVRGHVPSVWLRPLHHHSLSAVLVRQADTLLSCDPESAMPTLTTLLALAQQKKGAENLLTNGITHTLCISLDGIAASNDDKCVWVLGVRLTTSLLHSLGHTFLTHALDYVGVHQDNLAAALDVCGCVRDLHSLNRTVSVCRLFLALCKFKHHWCYSSPGLASSLPHTLTTLTAGVTALLSKKASLKHIIKTMYSSGLLSSDVAPVTTVTRRTGIGRSVSLDHSQLDDAMVTTSPAYTQLMEGLVSVLVSTLGALRHFTPPLDAMIVDKVLDLVEFPPLFTLSLTPPTIDSAMPPSLGTLTTCLTTILGLLNKSDVGSPTKSHSRGSSMSGRIMGHVTLLEVGVTLILSQSTRYLVDPSLDSHDKQLFKKELASELGTFLNSLLLNFSRKGVSSPGRGATPTRTESGSSGRVLFSEEHALFKLADSYLKQYLR